MKAKLPVEIVTSGMRPTSVLIDGIDLVQVHDVTEVVVRAKVGEIPTVTVTMLAPWGARIQGEAEVAKVTEQRL